MPFCTLLTYMDRFSDKYAYMGNWACTMLSPRPLTIRTSLRVAVSCAIVPSHAMAGAQPCRGRGLRLQDRARPRHGQSQACLVASSSSSRRHGWSRAQVVYEINK